MSTTNEAEVKQERRCIECGGEIDSPNKYVRCPKCREIRRAFEIQRRKEYAEKSKRLRELSELDAKMLKSKFTMNTQEQIQYMDEKIQKLEELNRRTKELEDKRRKFVRCTKCQWSSYTGSGWYCSLPYCWEDMRYD